MKILSIFFVFIAKEVLSAGFNLFDKPSEPDMENPRHYKYLEKPVNILNLDDFDVLLFEFKFVAILFLPEF